MKQFKLHWVGGSVEVITGHDFSEAFANAGYTKEDLKNLRWWEEVKFTYF